MHIKHSLIKLLSLSLKSDVRGDQFSLRLSRTIGLKSCLDENIAIFQDTNTNGM